MAVKRVNMTLDPVDFERFCKYAGKHGIKISTWVSLKMREFADEEEARELEKLNNKR